MKLKWVIEAGFVLLFFAILYGGYVYLSAYAFVKQMPRRDMFLCDKHGAISPEYVIQFQVGPKADEVQKYCSICFHEKMSKAEKI